MPPSHVPSHMPPWVSLVMQRTEDCARLPWMNGSLCMFMNLPFSYIDSPLKVPIHILPSLSDDIVRTKLELRLYLSDGMCLKTVLDPSERSILVRPSPSVATHRRFSLSMLMHWMDLLLLKAEILVSSLVAGVNLNRPSSLVPT